MKPALRLLQHASRITLFTRSNCSLCDNAKTVLSHVWDRRPFEYEETDVMKPTEKRWRDLYEFDTPVIHVQKASLPEQGPEVVSKTLKLMHHFTEQEVERLMDDSEK
ncbi:MAG: hypothetical protein M1819_000065 [Sarea resinae]|nr:MAG: hypothetical protein M1819_000065 [Sarea resinae]